MQSYHVSGSPFPLDVAPSTLAPATTRVGGQAVSLATAGVSVSFSVQVLIFLYPLSSYFFYLDQPRANTGKGHIQQRVPERLPS